MRGRSKKEKKQKKSMEKNDRILSLHSYETLSDSVTYSETMTESFNLLKLSRASSSVACRCGS